MKFIYSILFILSLISCQKKPTACLNVDDTLEAGTIIKLNSCSENYEFLTWNFGDNSHGSIEDSPSHYFAKEGKYFIELEAFADNGFRSDKTSKNITVSYRYIDRFEIIGTSTFRGFEVQYSVSPTQFQFAGQDGTGSFTEDNPYVLVVFEDVRLVPNFGEISFSGISNSTGVPRILGRDNKNFDINKENPVLIEGTDFSMKMYWKYKDF